MCNYTDELYKVPGATINGNDAKEWLNEIYGKRNDIWTDDMCDFAIRGTLNNPEPMPSIINVETFNNKVVKVDFLDGTYEKAICSDFDRFDLDTGITICYLKRLMRTNNSDGTKRYNKMIQQAHRVMDARKTINDYLKELEEERKRIRSNHARKKAAYKARRRARRAAELAKALKEAEE